MNAGAQERGPHSESAGTRSLTTCQERMLRRAAAPLSSTRSWLPQRRRPAMRLSCLPRQASPRARQAAVLLTAGAEYPVRGGRLAPRNAVVGAQNRGYVMPICRVAHRGASFRFTAVLLSEGQPGAFSRSFRPALVSDHSASSGVHLWSPRPAQTPVTSSPTRIRRASNARLGFPDGSPAQALTSTSCRRLEMAIHHGPTAKAQAPFELRAFRVKPELPGVHDSQSETHWVAFLACLRCRTTRCECPRPEEIPMLCGEAYDRSLLHEIVDSKDAVMPHFACLARARLLRRELQHWPTQQVDGAQESIAGIVVEGEVIARGKPSGVDDDQLRPPCQQR